jgi:uncharacterized protein YkwD
LLFAVLFLFSCGKDPEPPVDPITAMRTEARANYNDNYLGSSVTGFTWNGSVNSCTPGSLPDDIQEKVIKRVNYFRKQAGLYPIGLNKETSVKAQQMALMIQANGFLTHTPPPTWKCYTDDGYDAATHSNLGYGKVNADAIDMYMEDGGTPSLGHRRWIIYSGAGNFGHGASQFGDALYVIGSTGASGSVPEFITWPNKGFCPGELVPVQWSFSMPDADFSNATVKMTGPNGASVPFQYVAESPGYGDPTLSWIPQGVNTNTGGADFKYHVTVNGVAKDGLMNNYEYDVYIFKP